MEQITVKDMLSEMEAGLPFSMTVVSYNARHKEGGKVMQYGEAVLLAEQPREEAGASGRQPTQAESWAERKEAAKRKAPAHRKWYTRNIRVLQDGHPTSIIRKIHPPLVVIFNGKTVTA